MKILFMGTGANEGVPAFRCSCPHCVTARKEKGKFLRQNSCALVSYSGFRLLIDAPPQLSSLLVKYNVDETLFSAILLTHRHSDHILGISSIQNCKPSKGCILKEPVRIITSSSVIEYLNNKEIHCNEVFKFEHIKKFTPIKIGPFRVSALDTGHLRSKGLKEDSYGFIIQAAGKSLAYLVDAPKTLPAESMEYLKKHKPHLVIIDGTFSLAEKNCGHGDILSAIKLKENLPDSKIILSHISHKNHQPELLEKKLSIHNIEAAWDGLEIEIN